MHFEAKVREHKVVPLWILPDKYGEPFNLAKRRGRAHFLLLVCGPEADPSSFLQAMAPSRGGLVVCVECLCTWYGLADLCAHEGIPVVLGHALSRKAIHGGQATNEQIDAHQMAV